MTRAKETSLVEDLKIHDMRCQPDKHSGCHPTCPVLQAKENDMPRAKGIHLQEWKQALERLQVAERRFKEARRKARAHLWAYLNANFVRGSGQVAATDAPDTAATTTAAVEINGALYGTVNTTPYRNAR